MKIRQINGVPIYEEGDMVVRATDEYGGIFEQESFEYWMGSLKPCCYAIDVGSYTGLYAIAAAKAGSSVFAFEPNKKVFDRLLDNIHLNQVDIKVYNNAVGAVTESRYLSAKQHFLTSAGKLADNGIEVQCITLDSLFNKASNVSSIKIDVEGGELDVLKGASTLIQRNHPLVIAEALTWMDEVKIKGFMKSLGYDDPIHADKYNLIFQ